MALHTAEGAALFRPTALSGAPPDAGYTFGIGCTLLAALVYAGVTLITKAMTGMPAPLIALMHCGVGVLLLSFRIAWPTLAVSPAQWGWLIGLGVMHTALVYVLVYGALPKLRSASIAVLTFIYPAAAVGFDFLVYGHALSRWQVTGLILIVLAGAGVNLNWHWRRIYARRIG